MSGISVQGKGKRSCPCLPRAGGIYEAPQSIPASLSDFHLELTQTTGDPKVIQELLKSKLQEGGGDKHLPGPSGSSLWDSCQNQFCS